jgi:uncharacterized protein
MVLLFLLACVFAPACAESSLRQAVRNGDLMRTRWQIEEKGMSRELPDECGWTLLHYASYYQHTPLVEYLVGQFANVNARTMLHSQHCMGYSHIPAGSTPLMIAAYYGQTDIIRFLLSSGAQIRLKNQEGYSALMYARKYEFGEAADALEEASR